MNNTDGIIQELIKIYSKYYTHQDIKDLLKFYQSDLGKKLISTTPSIVQESMAAGQNWGQNIVPIIQERVGKRLEEEGIDIN